VARQKRRSHPSAPLYYPPPASLLNADQIAGALEIEFPQIAGQATDAQIPESAVTQHADAINLDDLGDVNAPTPADGDALTWDDTAGEWVNTPLGGGSPHDLDSHTDVDLTTDPPAVGESLIWDGTNWVPGTAGGAHTHPISDVTGLQTALDGKQPLLAQGDVVVTTASLADGVKEEGTVALGKNGLILKVVADRACWVRLYGTSAERTADNARVVEEDPDVPVLADLIFEAGALTINCAPLIGFANRDGTVTTTIYYAITNTSGASSTVEVTFTRMVLET
jgi:hypothetical protein